jgi:hypothetical protein
MVHFILLCPERLRKITKNLSQQFIIQTRLQTFSVKKRNSKQLKIKNFLSFQKVNNFILYFSRFLEVKLKLLL